MKSTRPIPQRAPSVTPRRTSSVRRVVTYAILGLAAALLFAIAAAELHYGFLRVGPRVDRAPVTDGAGVIALVDPDKLAPIAGDAMRAGTSWPLPDWAVQRILPHQGGVAAILNFEQERADIRVFVNPNGLAPVARRLSETLRFSETFPRIRWKKHAEEPAPGLLMKEGVVPFAPQAEDAFWYTWNQSMDLPPLAFEGGHLLEVAFDNRQGHAFLIVTSILEAYDIDLGAEETDISLSSLQFVREARMTADLAPGDTVRIRFVLGIVPEHIEKLGVVNLKVGLDDVLKQISQRWKRDYGLLLEGESRWEDTSIVYDYRLSSAQQAYNLLVNGELTLLD